MKKIYLDTKCVITIRQSRAIEGDIYIHAVKLLFMKYYKLIYSNLKFNGYRI
jgi:hypothetical protein